MYSLNRLSSLRNRSRMMGCFGCPSNLSSSSSMLSIYASFGTQKSIHNLGIPSLASCIFILRHSFFLCIRIEKRLLATLTYDANETVDSPVKCPMFYMSVYPDQESSLPKDLIISIHQEDERSVYAPPFIDIGIYAVSNRIFFFNM